MEEKKIDFAKIEKKWQKEWEKQKVFEVKENSKKKKFYVLEMFPYPSATGLHLGHALNYTIGDIFARFKKMMGFNVLHPMGFDALGLPAENAAIKAKTHPKDYTDKSVANFIRQQKALGLSYDWSRVINTTDSKYFKWDQWIFLKMLEGGLVYQKESSVNWCDSCNTVIANEQAQGGVCERCKTKIEIKHMKQWALKITDYADELYEKINDLKGWPDRIKAMQRNWIGKSHGTEIDFEINGGKWKIFTTRPDTIFGVTFMVVSAQHEKLDDLVSEEQKSKVEKFLKELGGVSEKELADMEKIGVFTGSYAINPVNGEKIPVYAGNFVVADYGSGMVMAVPAHDQRDFEFAKKYDIKIKQVIEGEIAKDRAYTSEGKLINSEEFNGIDNKEAIKKITDWLIKKKIGRKVVNFKLRDWGISRQRYWGTPIPIIHCEECGAVPVPEKDLPVELPKDVNFGKGNPLETNEKWLNIECPRCGGKGKREAETMDTFVNSSWYFLRYCDPLNDDEIFDKKKVNYWCPIDQYIGGAEHACMHLIYFRFYTKFLRDLGLLKFDEPAINLFNQGMLHGEDGNKMSKSLGNVIDPLEIIEEHGADALRMFLVSVASPDSDFNWSNKGIQGISKFLKKVLNYFNSVKIGDADAKIESKLNKKIKEISVNIEDFKYNLAVIKLRDLFNSLPQETSKEVLEKSLKLLSLFCPHIAEELWSKIGGRGLVSVAEWPRVDEKKIDNKLEEQEGQVDKTVSDINNILNIIREKEGKEVEGVYLYTIPPEVKNYDVELLSKKLGKKVSVFASNDKNAHDPEGKAKKAKPCRPAIYVE